MAGGVIYTHASDVKHYPGKITLHVFLTCLMAATGGLMFGYDIGISGGVTSMDSFLIKFFPDVYRKEKGESTSTKQYCKFDSQVLTLFTSSLYLAALIASFFASAITRLFGRKCSMFAGGAIFLIGAALNGAAENVAMLIVGRILLGIGVAFTTQVAVGTLIAVMFGISGEGDISRAYAFTVVVFICIYVAGFAWSWGPVGLLVVSESFPLVIRSAGLSITVSVSMLFTFAIAQAFLALLCRLEFGLFYFFGGWVLIMTTFVVFLVPETKGVPIEEMVVVWKAHWFWGRFIINSDDDQHVDLAGAIEMGNGKEVAALPLGL